MKSIQLIKSNLMTILTKRNLIISFSIFALHFYLFSTTYGTSRSYSILKALIVMFYGPFNQPLELFRWLFHQVPIFVLLGYFIDNEIKSRSMYILYRVGSIHTWFLGIIFSSLISTILYYFFGFGLSLLILIFYPKYIESDTLFQSFQLLNQSNPTILMFHLFSLLALTTYSMILIWIILSIVLKSTTISFSILIILISVSGMFTNVFPSGLQWLPPAQGMLIAREHSNMEFASSYVYLFTLNLFLSFLLFQILKRNLSEILSKNEY